MRRQTTRYPAPDNRASYGPRAAAVMLLAAVATGCAIPGAGDHADLTPEAQAYAAHCSACHALPHPKRHSYPEWQTLVAVMEQRMRERGIPPLDKQQRGAILAYLEHNSR